MKRNVIATLAAAVTLLCVTSSISTLQAEAPNESIDTRVALIVTQLINDATCPSVVDDEISKRADEQEVWAAGAVKQLGWRSPKPRPTKGR